MARLAGEFFSGEGARLIDRTIFAVGDEKQSIYSFQGADPSGFERMRRYFTRCADEAVMGLRPVDLQLSFRSSREILAAVDGVFEHEG